MVVVRIHDLGAAQDTTGQGEGSTGHDGGLAADEVLVVHGNLSQVQGHVLNLCVVGRLIQGEFQPCVDGRMADGPTQGVEDVPLHLGEHLLVVERAAHGLQLTDKGDAVLLVTVLGGDQEGRAANQLVVALVDDTARAVPVEEVDGQEEGLGEELERSVGLDEEVNQVGSHEPLDFLLDIDRGNISQGLVLLKVSNAEGLSLGVGPIDLDLLHVVNDLLNVCLVGLSGKDIAHGLLTTTAEHLGVVLVGRGWEGLLRLDEVRVALLLTVVRHDEGERVGKVGMERVDV